MTVTYRIITYFTALAAWAFIIQYHWKTHGDWRRSAVGWHVMAFTLVDAMIFSLLVILDLVPAMAGRRWFDWLYIGVVGMISATTVWRMFILWKVQDDQAGRVVETARQGGSGPDRGSVVGTGGDG